MRGDWRAATLKNARQTAAEAQTQKINKIAVTLNATFMVLKQLISVTSQRNSGAVRILIVYLQSSENDFSPNMISNNRGKAGLFSRQKSGMQPGGIPGGEGGFLFRIAFWALLPRSCNGGRDAPPFPAKSPPIFLA